MKDIFALQDEITLKIMIAMQVKLTDAEAQEILRINPHFSLEHFAKTVPFNNQGEVDRYVEALRKAGLK